MKTVCSSVVTATRCNYTDNFKLSAKHPLLQAVKTSSLSEHPVFLDFTVVGRWKLLGHAVHSSFPLNRGGVYDEILPESEGFSEGSGKISSYTLTRVTIQSFSITSTSQYFLVLTP